MTIADTSVVWAHSDMVGAPALSGQPGSLLGVLDAMLIDGHTVRPVDSVVVADGVATFHLSAGNPYPQHFVIEASAGPAALNRRWRVHTSAGSAFSVVVDDVVPPGTYYGVSVKAAPAGWARPFVGGDRAAYQSTDPASTQLYLYVDDTLAQYASVRGYEHMTDIDTGAGPFPASATSRWVKSNQTNSTTRPWVVVADGAMIWVCIAPSSNSPSLLVPNQFGDLVPYSTADAYYCVLSAHSVYNNSAIFAGHPVTTLSPSAGNGQYRTAARNAAGTAQSVQTAWAALTSAGRADTLCPDLTDAGGGVQIGPAVIACDGGSLTSFRGVMAGLHPVLQTPDWGRVSIVDAGAAGVFLCARIRGQSGEGYVAFLISEPW